MNLLHLVLDAKFIDFFAGILGEYEGIDNAYIVYKSDNSDALCYIKTITPLRVVNDAYFSSERMILDLKNCDVLVVHYLTAASARMIIAAPSSVKVVWSGWGGDYYGLFPGGENYLLESQTRKLVSMLKLNDAKQNPARLIKFLLRPIRKQYIRQFILKKAISRVDYFSSPIPNDYFLLKKYFPKIFRARYIQLSYANVSSSFVNPSECSHQRDILVGNSATPTNNHLESFEKLSSIDIADRRIVVPLSYGDPNYRDEILKIGKKIFGSRFYPITDFLPFNEYSKILASCEFAIMNHKRQQAIGNIGALLCSGSKVFMNKKNVLYQFFLSRGASIFTIDQIDSNVNIFTPLTEQEKIKNRKVIENFWGDDLVKKNFDSFVEIMKGTSKNPCPPASDKIPLS